MRKSLSGCFAAVVFGLFLSGCAGRTESEPGVYDWTGKEAEIASELLLPDRSLLGTSGAYVCGEWLITAYSRQADYEYELFRICGDSLLGQGNFVRRGSGPDEVIQSYLQVDPTEKALYVLADNMSFATKLYRIDLSSGAGRILDPRQWGKWDYPDKPKMFTWLVVDSVALLTRPDYESSDLATLYTRGDTTRRAVGLACPEPNSNAFDPMALSIAYSGRWAKHPTEPRFVYMARYGGYVQTFRLEQGRATDIRVLYNDRPQFSVAADGFNIRYKDESRYGYSAAVSDRYIYLLESGRTFGDPRTGREEEQYRRIHVFTWDGEPVRMLHMDRQVNGGFSVTPDDRYLYFHTVDLEQGEEQIRRAAL